MGSWVVVFIFLLHSLQPQILILCLKSQINSEGEAGVVCFGNINSLLNAAAASSGSDAMFGKMCLFCSLLAILSL